MTQSRENNRLIVEHINNKITNIRTFAEAEIIDFYEKDKKVKIKIFPEEKEAFARILIPIFDKESNFIKMPIKGAKCLITFISNDRDIYENIIVIGFLQDDNNKHDYKESDGSKDYNYMSINNHSGKVKIDLYKNNSNKYNLLINSNNFINCKAVDEINLVCDKVSLGEPSLTNNDDSLVKRPHLDKYNELIDTIQSLLSDLINQPTLGDLGIPLPLAVRNPASLIALTTYITKASSGIIKDNNINITSKTKAK